MYMQADLVIKNCTIVTPDGLMENAGVAAKDGKIVAVGSSDALPSGSREIDATGKYLTSGIIDCHIHNREPGLEYKEDWGTATQAAAAGGVTTVIGMPNCIPVIDAPEHLKLKFEKGEEKAYVDFQSYVVITSDNATEESVNALNEAGCVGYKVFLGTTIGAIPPPNDGELLDAMHAIAKTGKRLGFHEEDDEILKHYEAQFIEQGLNDPIYHSWSRPPVCEREAVGRTILFSEHTGCPIHEFHLASGSGAQMVLDAKKKGINVTAETMPHYLWFNEEVMRDKGNVARIQPPIRDQIEQDMLWDIGIHGGGIDCIATDHSPHTDEEKGMDDPFQNTWNVISGFVGLESEVAAMLTFVNDGKLTLEKWVDMHSKRPAEIWGMYPEKGSLRIGTDADFTVFDLNETWTMDRKNLHSKNTATPFHGETFKGRATMTVVRGKVVYEDGKVVGERGFGTLVDVDKMPWNSPRKLTEPRAEYKQYT